MSKITDAVLKIVSPIAKQYGCDIFDIEYKKEGADYVLRVIVEKIDPSENMSINDCENISRALSDDLDSNDPIPNSYMLEVSSPGIDRPLRNEKDYEKYMGSLIDVGLYKQKNGAKVLTGSLLGFGENYIIIKIDDEEVKIEKKETSYIKLAVTF